MKRSIVFLFCIIFVLSSFVAAEELSFDDFKTLITKNVTLKGFTLNESRTSGSKSRYRVEFTGDKEKMEMISISLFLGIEKFSMMDKAGKPESYTFKDRPFLFADGNKAGMAVLRIILKNKRGKLSISHRVFGGKFMSKTDLEKIAENIGLENLEK